MVLLPEDEICSFCVGIGANSVGAASNGHDLIGE